MASLAARRAAIMAAVLCAGVLATACGSAPGSSPGAGQATQPAATTTGTTSAAPSPSQGPSVQPVRAGCPPSALRALVDTSQGGAAAGSVYYPIDFTNISQATCTMYGYPGVSFVTGPSGSIIGKPATRNPALRATTVRLAPGGVAHATVQVVQAGNYNRADCKPVTAHWLKIYPPNQFGAIYARLTIQACSKRLPSSLGSQLSVYVVRPGAGKAGQGP